MICYRAEHHPEPNKDWLAQLEPGFSLGIPILQHLKAATS